MDENRTKRSENLLFPELFSLTPVGRKRTEVSFTAPVLSSQGGLLLLREFDHRLGFIDRLNRCIDDKRCFYLIRHTYKEMLVQRINDYYGEYCYIPLFIFEGISGNMILPLLRGGRRNKSTDIHGILRRLIGMMRRHWKKSRFIVRGDAHFCSKEFMEWGTGKDYVRFAFGLTGNSVLNARVKPCLDKALKVYREGGGRCAPLPPGYLHGRQLETP